MDKEPLSENDKLLQRYYDAELEESERKKVKSLLAADETSRSSLRSYERMSELLQLAAPEASDELARHRDWEKIAPALQRPSLSRGRKITYWLSAAAAAAVFFFFYHPFGTTANNELIVESINCTYDSFMLIQPLSEDVHTIIWINDRSALHN